MMIFLQGMMLLVMRATLMVVLVMLFSESFRFSWKLSHACRAGDGAAGP